MVSYQTWTSIAFDVARQKGAQFQDIEDGSRAVQVFAEIWRDRKTELSPATIQEARAIARDEIDS